MLPNTSTVFLRRSPRARDFEKSPRRSRHPLYLEPGAAYQTDHTHHRSPREPDPHTHRLWAQNTTTQSLIHTRTHSNDKTTISSTTSPSGSKRLDQRRATHHRAPPCAWRLGERDGRGWGGRRNGGALLLPRLSERAAPACPLDNAVRGQQHPLRLCRPPRSSSSRRG